MSTRHIVLLIFALVSASNLGCCGYMQGYGGQMCGSSCASCGFPEASCGCEDVCCEASCGCGDVYGNASCGCNDRCEATCGCDDYCEASCGCGDVYGASCGCEDVCSDVGCGSGVGSYPLLGQCWFLQRLGRAFNGNYYGCNGGCSSEGYWSEWQNDPPCNCQAGSTGGHYGGAYGRRAFLAKQHQNISEELRFADEGSETTYR